MGTVKESSTSSMDVSVFGVPDKSSLVHRAAFGANVSHDAHSSTIFVTSKIPFAFTFAGNINRALESSFYRHLISKDFSWFKGSLKSH